MTSDKGPFWKANSTGHAMNPNILYLRKSTMDSFGCESPRRRRRFPSRVVSSSRAVFLSIDEVPSITSDFSTSQVLQPKESEAGSWRKANAILRHSAASAPARGVDVDEKQFSLDCEYFTLKPLCNRLPSCPELDGELEYVTRRSVVLPTKNPSKERVYNSPSKQRLDSFQTCSSLRYSSQTEWLDDTVCTQEDVDTLPPYYKIIPQMFYRFAGISPYSNSNLLQSREDFKQLMTCLGLEHFFEEFLSWFPKPKLIKTNQGYITFDMFCDLFCCKFAQTVLEVRQEYETLCSAIMTMKCLDKKKLNRIEFQEFAELYRALYEIDISTEKVNSVFNKYDLDGIGLLTIVNIFNFCSEEDTDME